jgi:hypothetical protein
MDKPPGPVAALRQFGLITCVGSAFCRDGIKKMGWHNASPDHGIFGFYG